MSLRWKIAQWFELRWWQNYLRPKDAAAYNAWKTHYWQNTIERISGEAKKPYGYFMPYGSIIADLGCGPAGIFMILPDYKVTAIDPLIDSYENHTSFFRKSDYQFVNFVNNTIEDFNPTQKFDVVFCMNAINHVRDIEAAFKRVKDICKAEGTIVVSIDAHNHSFFKHLFHAIPGDILHPHQYDLAEYANMLSTDGWKVQTPLLLKRGFFFHHYLLVAQKLSSPR